MFSRWPIRYKLLLGAVLVWLSVAVLFWTGLQGIYSYRNLARSISLRSAELPLASQWTQAVDELRFTYSQLRGAPQLPQGAGSDLLTLREQFRADLLAVNESLRRYRVQLDQAGPTDPLAGGQEAEQRTLQKIERSLSRIEQLVDRDDWVLDPTPLHSLGDELEELNRLADELPSHLQRRMHAFRDQVRGQYHRWITVTVATTLSAVVLLGAYVKLFFDWVFRPLRILIDGSRKVAGGHFDHRIELRSHDEMAELAGALNAMTERFQQIRDDLDRQVRQRTREVVRSEQMASLGYLAAGVAHEINNPLASIAWCAESLESRLEEAKEPAAAGDARPLGEQLVVLQKYLRRIQDEAFRCKGITERLLDFSRQGSTEKRRVDVRELTANVAEMLRHVARRRRHQIQLLEGGPVWAEVNPQEIKQVVLNLITNALDSLEAGGLVQVAVQQAGQHAEIVVQDNGCGMTPEVLDRVFEPFFTRRQHGQGTGLGLSIAYRIVAEHGGAIEAHSDGPGRGSRFRVRLPLRQTHESNQQATRRAA